MVTSSRKIFTVWLSAHSLSETDNNFDQSEDCIFILFYHRLLTKIQLSLVHLYLDSHLYKLFNVNFIEARKTFSVKLWNISFKTGEI